jgi:hypothetical protein
MYINYTNYLFLWHFCLLTKIQNLMLLVSTISRTAHAWSHQLCAAGCLFPAKPFFGRIGRKRPKVLGFIGRKRLKALGGRAFTSSEGASVARRRMIGISYVFFSRFCTFFSRFWVRSLEYSYVFSDPNIGRRYVPILKTFLRFFLKSEFRRRKTAGRPRKRA